MSVRARAATYVSPEAAERRPALRRPRILQFITSFEVGGTELQLMELLKRIDRDRYDVLLAAIHHRGALYSEAVGLAGDIPAFPLRKFYDANALAQVMRLRSLLVSREIDILHAHDFYSGLLGSMAAKLAGVRILASQRHLQLSDRRVHDWGTRVIHRLSDQILVNSEAVRSRVVESGAARPRKVILIHNGLRERTSGSYDRPESRARIMAVLGLSEPVKLVVTVARLDAVKGHRFLLDAAASLSDAYPSLHYVIIGGGPLHGEIRSQASRLGLQHRLHLLGERGDVLDILPGFDISVLPSLHEGFPNAVMESMAASVPVIAASVGGTPELITHGATGYLVPPADSAGLASQIAFAIDNWELTSAIARAGRDFVLSRFNMDRMVASVQGAYDQIIAMRR
jgi:glycosyltransferase involved in cell wall biosynthesis